MTEAPAPQIKRVCIYCGSSMGFDSLYKDAAAAMGRYCARRGVGIVYGGGGIGLMGVLADAALAEGGEVIGVIPKLLVELEKEHKGVTRLIEVDTMHQRKATMADLADAFVALPGGVGTLEELVEVLTWQQLGYHQKPVGVFDVAGFFQPLSELLQHMEQAGFLRAEDRQRLQCGGSPEAVFQALESKFPKKTLKWI